MNGRLETMREDLVQLQFEVLCGLLWHSELAAMVTPHLFAGSPASVCIVKAMKRGKRGVYEITKEACRIAKTSLVQFPVMEVVRRAEIGGSKPGTAMRIRVLKAKARELYELERSVRAAA
jgi:hypothetical protein